MKKAARVSLVTGAARGIGEAIAMRLARAGSTVLLFDVQKDKIENVAQSINKLGLQAYAYAVDVSNKAQVVDAVHGAIAQFGAVDILVNNAGIMRDNLLTNISEEDWDHVMTVNTKSAFLLSQAVMPKMKERKFGRIVNISSRSWLGNIGQANYAASKGALVSLTRTLALELAKDGITVNAVAPGLIATEMTKKIPEKIMDKLLRMQPSGRIGSTDDIARAVEFLAADESNYITGQVLHVDGGKSCGILSL
ncbi:MAG: beta-ketoacyl-ACP reductase [Bdellovibrionales bacterium RBG_16_40_8]|nr:MAG: beta-ketoacyl-ACP reductase [Bdellovibrionales bacterium RBG_16_40_8]